MAGAVGRPRKNSPRRRGSTAREILDASSELFTTQGSLIPRRTRLQKQ